MPLVPPVNWQQIDVFFLFVFFLVLFPFVVKLPLTPSRPRGRQAGPPSASLKLVTNSNCTITRMRHIQEQNWRQTSR